MAKNPPQRTHIVKRDNGWAVKKEGAQRATKIYDTKDKAITGAQKEKKAGSDLIIHKKDGSIEKWQKAKK
ncbi:MAG: DUF2188 domain-containing protein [Bacteroidota bacterium]